MFAQLHDDPVQPLGIAGRRLHQRLKLPAHIALDLGASAVGRLHILAHGGINRSAGFVFISV